MMQISVGKWGNSSAIRIPASLLKAIDVKPGDKLAVEIQNGKLILGKEPEDTLTFEQLFEGYSGEKFESELVELKPLGNELW
jgi:antitoxin MazE